MKSNLDLEFRITGIYDQKEYKAVVGMKGDGERISYLISEAMEVDNSARKTLLAGVFAYALYNDYDLAKDFIAMKKVFDSNHEKYKAK